MPTSLSNLLDNLSEINIKECQSCMEKNNFKSDCDFMGIKDNQLGCKCKKCNKKQLKSVTDLIKNFPSIYPFCYGDNNKFVLFVKRDVCPY